MNALQNLLRAIIGRFVDTQHLGSATNTTTAFGASLMGLGTLLVNQPEPIIQAVGFSVGVVGFGISLFKSKK